MRKILSSGPERYWTGFLLFILFLAVLTLVFDWRVFQKFSPAGLSPSPENLEMPVLNRAALLGFADALEKSGIFKEVHSPVSNLLKGGNMDFSLILDLG